MGPDEFRLRYIAENVPLVLDGLAASWPALQRWITRDGMPDYEYLKARYGGEQVPVTLQNYENETTADFGCSRMVFEDYLTYLQCTESHKSHNSGVISYLKDWHFAQHHENEAVYTVPPHVSDDWMNSYWSAKTDGDTCDGESDFRFVYCGPAGSWTPLHTDVFDSFSWSCNLCGRKRWLLFQPSDALKLEPHMHSVRKFEDLATDAAFGDSLASVRPLEIIQEAGELIFVPSGWAHEVTNLDIVISINC